VVSISREAREQTEQRLREVIAAAEFVTLDGAWAFREAPLGEPPELNRQVLAAVRDETSWSWLTTAGPDDHERFAVFSFHFPSGLDNSGFVGWLASALKQELGTGVFVVCGHNSRRGGIYDYWGCPAELRDEVAHVIETLRALR
jgi:cell wall-associated NlpC family hydrolase